MTMTTTTSSTRELAALERQHMREADRNKRAAKIALLYAQKNGSHKAVAEALGLSVPSATKLIKYAREHGFIVAPKRGAEGSKPPSVRMAEWRESQRAKGLCIQHARVKARTGTDLCEACHAAHAASQRRTRKAEK